MRNTMLAPCPFCGGVGLLHTQYNLEWDAYELFIQCRSCGARGQSFFKPYNAWKKAGRQLPGGESAIDAWNRRTTENPLTLLFMDSTTPEN